MAWFVAILALTPGIALAATGAPAPTSTSTSKSTSTPAPAVAGAQPRSAGPPRGLRLTTAATTERIPLPPMRGPIVLSFDALAHHIRLAPARGESASALLARVSKHAGFLCPKVDMKEGGVELTCRSARMEGQLTREGKSQFLDLNELRGLPWRPGPDAAPSYHYDPWRIGLGQRCPGKSPAAQGECALKEGHILDAATHFRAALDSSARQMACVRLGDLAMRTGDPLTAAGWYRRAGPFGFFGRIAESRLCELDGRCLETTEQVTHAFDTNGLPEPLRAEMALRGARAEAYAGRLPSAAHLIARQVRAHGIASVCREDGELLCRRILVEAMRATQSTTNPLWPLMTRATKEAGPRHGPPVPLQQAERDYLEELLEVYLALPSWEKGPYAVEMSEQAASLAARLGAPGFGGNLLASLAPQVPDAQLSNHLLLAAETFLEGDNWARARIVAEYAQSRLASKGRAGQGQLAGPSLQSPRWTAVFRALATHATQDDVSPADRAAIEAELTATLDEVKQAREVLDRADGVLRGAGEVTASPSAGRPKVGGPTADVPVAGGPAPAAPSVALPAAAAPPAVAKNGEGRR